MRKIAVLAGMLALMLPIFAGNGDESIINKVLADYVSKKVDHYQGIIKFSDTNSAKLKQLELQYLLNVKKAEDCIFCFTKKQIERLTREKYEAIEKLLPRNEFIKYKAIDNNEIKHYPEWAQ